MKKTTMKKIRARFLETMLVSGVITAIMAVTLGIYAFLAYPHCFFTTGGFEPLSVAAPLLNKMMLSNFAISAISFTLLYSVVKLTKRHH